MSSSTSHQPGFARARAWLRVLAALTVVVSVSGYWLAHRVLAHLSERALLAGRELSRANLIHSGTTQVLLNGQALSLNSTVTPEPVSKVLERFARLCARDSGGVREELAQRVAGGKKLPAGLSAERFGLVENRERDGEGTAACFARPDSSEGFSGLAHRLERVVETGDFSELGQFRYVFARTVKAGAGSHVISIWADGPLRPGRMFPAEGDVPGSDIVSGVRPPRAQRLLTGEGRGTGYQVALYESQASASEVLDSYDTQLARHGYAPARRGSMDGFVPIPARLYARAGRDALVVLASEKEGKTVVSALRVGMTDYVELRH